MKKEGYAFSLIMLLLAFALGGVALYLVTKETPNTQTNSVNTSDQNAAPEIGERWQTFFHQGLSVLVPLPTGFTVCEKGSDGFELRTDDCQTPTKPTYLIRRSASWNDLSLQAAFDDAFAQQLREAGLASGANVATKLSGKGIDLLLYHFSETFTGALVAERAGNRKVAVEIQRDLVAKDTSPELVEPTLQSFLTKTSFSQVRNINTQSP